MKTESNRAKILKVLFQENDVISPSFTGPELRIKSGVPPIKFSLEIRALINLNWVYSSNYRYSITEAGKKAITECMEKEASEGKNQELFK